MMRVVDRLFLDAEKETCEQNARRQTRDQLFPGGTHKITSQNCNQNT